MKRNICRVSWLNVLFPNCDYDPFFENRKEQEHIICTQKSSTIVHPRLSIFETKEEFDR